MQTEVRAQTDTAGDQQGVEDLQAALAQKNQEVKELEEALAGKDKEIENLKAAIKGVAERQRRLVN